MAKASVEVSQFEDVDRLAWRIVADIFTANGIRMTEEDGDPLLAALTAELARRVTAMRAGIKPPTPEQQVTAASRLRGYGCWMYPWDGNPTAMKFFIFEGEEWQHFFESDYRMRRPFPGEAAAQAVARLTIAGSPASETPPEETAPAKSVKARRRKS